MGYNLFNILNINKVPHKLLLFYSKPRYSKKYYFKNFHSRILCFNIKLNYLQ